MKHFKLTDETKIIDGEITLFRIEATVDSKHAKAGEKGGWVEKEENLSGNAWVADDAWVFGDAVVAGKAQVYGDARVGGHA